MEKIDKLTPPLKAVYRVIKENKPNCNSVAISYETDIPANIVRMIICQLRDEGIPIQTIKGGYIIKDDGYVENLQKQIMSKIAPTIKSYNQKLNAYNGTKNKSLSDDDFKRIFEECK